MELMSVRDYARKVSSKEATIRNMCKKGILPSVKIGVGWKIDPEKADEYFQAKMAERLNQHASYLQQIQAKIKEVM